MVLTAISININNSRYIRIDKDNCFLVKMLSIENSLFSFKSSLTCLKIIFCYDLVRQSTLETLL